MLATFSGCDMRLYDLKGHRASKFRSDWFYSSSSSYKNKKKTTTKTNCFFGRGHEKQVLCLSRSA